MKPNFPYEKLPYHRSVPHWSLWLRHLAEAFARARMRHDAMIRARRRAGIYDRLPEEDFRTHASGWLGDTIYDCDFDWAAFTYLVEDYMIRMGEITEDAA